MDLGDGSPSKELVDIHMRAYEGLKRAGKAVKPGATTEEVVLASWEEQILNRSLGHGIGVGANDIPFLRSGATEFPKKSGNSSKDFFLDRGKIAYVYNM